ncbi:methyltransferase [Burkholderia multivorans]|uniref:DNA cytosine methyltransferase n=1 Tax=Burkholderia multivorans TaxID=87883 RepID=UPI000CFE8CBA|nr:DNA cytosine methyltransferase [Burkholderia multivorans]PRE60562.1 methyltransferase [Burkholderia multivorans]PRF16460.1 methyltransferase [Burkholderia multivorans]
MPAYYNEHDSYAAQWLRNLIAAGHIAPGDVDERSIEDVRPDDLRAYDQCHFFAGIGVWSYALRRAGWPDDRPVWTGSCPCQPFSAAGKGAGFDDERHLWPAWYWLIGECRPPIIFGEQVASKDIDPWIDLVQANLEAVDYAVGCVPFPSAGVGAPHIRDRAYFVAHANSMRGRRHARAVRRAQVEVDRQGFEDGREPDGPRTGRATRIVADTDRWQRDGIAVVRGIECDGQDSGRPQGGRELESCGVVRELADSADIGLDGRRTSGAGDGRDAARIEPQRFRDACGLAYANGGDASTEGIQRSGKHGQQPEDGRIERIEPTGPTNSFWRAADWLLCRDGKWRPVEPGTFPLADGAPSRVGRLRAYGNAINAEAATQFILAARDILT